MSAFSPQEQKHLKEVAYSEFLRAKIKLAQLKGFDVPLADIHPGLKPHTRDIVRWALAGGQRAIFASFGLHKTSTNLEVMRQIGIHRPGGIRGIVAPLGVRQEFSREVAKRFTGDQAVDLRFIRSDAEIDDPATIYMTNYESVREAKVDVTKWQASGLDEASVLRSYGSKTYQEFLPMFEPVEFKFVYTATPSPNRFKELIHYAGYLGVMDTGQALTRFFQRDSEKAGNLTLYAEHIRVAGKLGTEFVMQAVRFFGKSKHYAEPWQAEAPPAVRAPSRSIAAMGANAQAFEDPFAKRVAA